LNDLAATYLDVERWPENEAYLWGVDLYNHGFAWEAHEAWEGLWRAVKHDETEATFLQGLIQCAAAQVKMSMGDDAATRRLLERGLARLTSVRQQHGDRYMGLDLARYLAEHASRLEGAAFPYLWLIGG
jgi:predicted metal-dependent hydrolase